jgi:heme-degrading monooxygenase HmoA
MSVLMTLRVKGDPGKIEEIAAADPDKIRGISDRGKQAGAIHHAFYGSEDGQIMVLDEWDTAENFQAFFEAEAGEIGPLMQQAGVTTEPEITFWRKLDSKDEF